MKKLFAGILFVTLLTAAAETARVITAAPVAIQAAVLREAAMGTRTMTESVITAEPKTAYATGGGTVRIRMTMGSAIHAEEI